MASGGARPGAGRKKAVATAVTTGAKAAAATVPTTLAGDIDDPEYILLLLQRGECLPDGRPITAPMVAAAKERLPYVKAKRATQQGERTDNKAIADFTDDELRAIIAAEVAARTGGGGATGAARGADHVSDVRGAGAAEPGGTQGDPPAGRAPPFSMFQAPGVG